MEKLAREIIRDTVIAAMSKHRLVEHIVDVATPFEELEGVYCAISYDYVVSQGAWITDDFHLTRDVMMCRTRSCIGKLSKTVFPLGGDYIAEIVSFIEEHSRAECGKGLAERLSDIVDNVLAELKAHGFELDGIVQICEDYSLITISQGFLVKFTDEIKVQPIASMEELTEAVGVGTWRDFCNKQIEESGKLWENTSQQS